MKKYNLFVLGLLSAFLVSCADDILIKDSNSEESEPTITSSEETPEDSSSSTSSDNGGSNGGGTNTNPHKNHTVYHYAARSATCTEAGNLEAWYCYNDHTYYLSNPGGIVIDTQSVITPNPEADYYIAPLGHDLSFEGFEWNTDLTEAKAVYVCSHDASHVFKEDAELEDLTAPSDQPTCYTSGTRTVRATYKDQTDTKVEHYNHLEHVLILVKGNPATCTEDGTLDYYTCDRGCGAVLVVDELTNELREVTDLAELVDHAHGHTPANMVYENETPATCTEAGSRDEVTYCAECGIELNRFENVAISATGHAWGDWNETTAPTCTSDGEKTRTCSKCGAEETQPIEALGHAWSEWNETLGPTCQHEGEESRTCSRCQAKETKPIDALSHSYGATTYAWDANKKVVTSTRTCTSGTPHEDIEHPYTYQEPFFTCEGGRSELAGSLTEKEKNGDINIFFSNVNGDNSKGAPFTTDLVLRIEHDNNLPSMKDNIAIRFDNGCHYKANFIGYNPNSGDSYALFYTDLTTGNKTYSVGTPTDNRSLYTSYINGSFVEDYKVFAANSVVLIHAEYDGSTGELTLTITYFTLVSGYERYLGYKQTFTATVDENDRTSFNVVNSPRITRMIYNSSDKSVDSTIDIEKFTYTGTLDFDVINTYTNNGSSWNKKTIYQYNGHTLQKVAANEATCTEEGNVEYYKCLAHENEYYLDLEMTSPTTLEDVTLPSTGHNYGEVHYESVNGDDEIHAYRICGNDETHIEEETVNTVYSVVTAPTCTEKGQGKYTATFENKAFGTRVKYVDIDALGHDWNEPTYVWNGDNSKVTASRTCSRCDAVESEEVAISSEVIKAATELEVGTRRYTSASFENEAFEVQTKDVEIPVLSHVHNYNTFVETVAPTCTEQGYDIYKCSCDETIHTNLVAANGHSWGEWSQTTAPTCTEKGEETRTCSVCGATDTKEVAANGHTPSAAVNENVIAPTCVEDGSHDEVIYCSVCETELSRTVGVVDTATGHDFSGSYYLGWVGTDKVQYIKDCKNDATHKQYGDTVYEEEEQFFTCDGGRSELAGSLTSDGKQGDINLYFANGTSSSDRGMDYSVRMVLDLFNDTNGDGNSDAFANMSDAFIVKIDNNYHFSKATAVGHNIIGGESKHKGDSYVMFKTDLTSTSKAYTRGTNTDNSGTFTIKGESFASDYCVFASNCVVVIDITYNHNTGAIVMTITYYTRVAECERYLGYTQTYNATVDSTDITWNDINSVRVTRTYVNNATTSTIGIETITHSDNLDYDIVNTYSSGNTWYKRCIKSIGKNNGDSYVS